MLFRVRDTDHLARRSDMGFDISVVICTRNRATSLKETLTHLADGDRSGIDVEIVVVDNGGTDATPEVARDFENHFPVRYVFEPRQGVFGKSHALNRVLDEGLLGRIVAVLDDDMTPHRDWFQGVAALCRRWPDKDIFTGRSYVVWPTPPSPEVAESIALRTWMYSIIDEGKEDILLDTGRWYSGNHFWFRSRCLESGIRFDDIWLTEPKFMLDLEELGYGGVSGPDAVVGHRVQEHLLDQKVIRERAAKVGRSNADVRLRPYRQTVRHARFMKQHPLLGRLFCIAKLIQSTGRWLRGWIHPTPDKRFVATVVALESITYHFYLLRTAMRMPEYRILRLSQPGHQKSPSY
jgi:glycosyltransferase involved in cell wall biosynthesis